MAGPGRRRPGSGTEPAGGISDSPPWRLHLHLPPGIKEGGGGGWGGKKEQEEGMDEGGGKHAGGGGKVGGFGGGGGGFVVGEVVGGEVEDSNLKVLVRKKIGSGW